MTEPRPTTSNNGHDDRPSLADQLVLSSAGLASQGISSGRQLLSGLVDAVDTLVVGLFAAGRDAWAAGISGVKSVVADL